MWSFTAPSCTIPVLITTLLGTGCTDSNYRTAQLEIERQRLAIEQERLESERARAEEARRQEAERQEIARLDALALQYARSASAQLMEAIGGGQDLIVQPGRWLFDRATYRFEIPMEVSFNGILVRTNNYRVAGVLSVNENGSNAQFSRSGVNENYRMAEGRMATLFFTAAGVAILSDLASSQKSSY